MILPGGCGQLVQGTIDVWRVPADSPRSAAAIRVALDHFGCLEQSGCLGVSSTLPRSKGYASGTADTAGTIYPLAHALRRSVTPRIVKQTILC